jgi:N-acetylneuraminic acid mutarotase
MYVLGRYVDPDARPNISLENDFWKYEALNDKWTCISGSTSEDGGPELIYDHQMVMDTTKENLFVFGGRVVGADSTQVVYSGLYVYSVGTQVWKLLRTETETPIELKSRIGHSMLLNETSRELFIFAGQRNKDYLADFYVYHLDSDDLRQISRDYSKQGGPDAGFTQRATIDPELGEFYVFSGLIKEKNNTQESVKNSLWVYNIRKEIWSKIYQNENTGADYWSKMSGKEPCPRFAHQLVYDYKSKTQYLFGGNPGDNSQPNMRLDDFWQLELQRWGFQYTATYLD